MARIVETWTMQTAKEAHQVTKGVAETRVEQSRASGFSVDVKAKAPRSGCVKWMARKPVRGGALELPYTVKTGIRRSTKQRKKGSGKMRKAFERLDRSPLVELDSLGTCSVRPELQIGWFRKPMMLYLIRFGLDSGDNAM